MAGGRMKLDVLAAGSVVPPFQMQDAVHAGVLEGGHGVADTWYRKHRAFSLFGSPPSFGWDPALACWGGSIAGGGEALYRELIDTILKLNVVGAPLFPDADAAARLVPQRDQERRRLQGDEDAGRFGLAADLFTAARCGRDHTAQSATSCRRWTASGSTPPRSTIRAPTCNSACPTSPSFTCSAAITGRPATLEASLFNKPKFDALPGEFKAILRHAALAASTDQLGDGLGPLSKGHLDEIRSSARRRCGPQRTDAQVARGRARRLGPPDRRAVEGALLRQGDRLAEGLGEAHAALFAGATRSHGVELAAALQAIFAG